MSRYIFIFTQDDEDVRRLEKALPLEAHKVQIFNIKEFNYPQDVTDAFLLGKELLSDETLITKINGQRIFIGPSIHDIKTGKVSRANLISAIQEFFLLEGVACIEDTFRALDKFEKAGVELKIPAKTKDLSIPNDLSYDELKALLAMAKYLGFYKLEFDFEK